ncbi:MAG: AMP-binding protein [Bacteroidales bacterium]|nr:AMP-binding protein [Bacteroidales bacterium]MBN2748274.1 AMP-binding protein [Bacteroidales bacterium]
MKYNFIKEFVERSIRENWDQPSLSDYQGKTFTYSEVAMQIHKLHRTFEAWEVNPGDKIAIIGRNNSNWAITYLAVISYGAVVVPILADFAASDVHHIVTHSDSVMLFAGEFVWENLDEESMPGVRAIYSLAKFQPLVARSKDMAQRAALALKKAEVEAASLTPEKVVYRNTPNSNLAVISYTSGTTGFSKGVMLSHNSLAANIDFGRKNIGVRAKDKIVSFLPLAHAYGVAFEFLMPFAVGCHVTFLTRTPSPKIILQAFQEIKPRLVLAVPLILEKIYKKQLLPIISKPTIRALINTPVINRLIYKKVNKTLTNAFGGNFIEIVIGGAALNAEVEDFLRKIKFPVTVGYGMTECGPLISYAGWRESAKGSCGKLLPTLEMKIDSVDPQNEVGEILVRGENVMEGYYKNAEATTASIDSDGWLHTGDLGVVDSNGFIYIRGRSKSMILGPSGQNIYPEEIEAKLNNMPFVQESLVIESNHKLVALIYPEMETADEAGLSLADIEKVMEEHRKTLNATLPNFMQVSRVKLYPEEFEKTPKRSIKRFLYQAAVENSNEKVAVNELELE